MPPSDIRLSDLSAFLLTRNSPSLTPSLRPKCEHALTPSIAAIYYRHAQTQSTPNGSSSTDPRPDTFASLMPASADPRSLTASRSLPSHAGTVWSISPSPLGTKLAIGCEDGRVRLIDIAQGRFQHLDQSSPLSYRRCLADRDNQVSIKTQKGTESDSSEDDSDDEEDDENYSGKLAGWTESFLLGGTSVSHAVLWEVSTGQILARLQTPTARTRFHIDGPTVVWSCAVLPNGTTVLGDSTGRVTFCDGRTRVPIPGAASAPLAVVPTAAAATASSSKSEEVKEDANRFEVRLNFRYASILLVDTVEPAVVDQEEGEEGEGE
ncbi:hypothetical protein CF326_g9339, partial [Tilletia indica]